MNVNVKEVHSTKKLVYLSLLIALSFVGSLIKIQGTIAFDSLPAFFAALFIGPVSGMLVGFAGHMITAIISGFPFTLPIHFIIAVEMALTCWIFGYVYKKSNILVSSIIAIILNAIVATYISVFAMQLMGIIPNANQMFMVLVVPLSIASVLNVVLAGTLFKVLDQEIVKSGNREIMKS